MSDVSGQISVNLSFADTTSLPTKTVLKSIGIAEDVEVSGGQVAIVSGTVGTAALSFDLVPTTYRNASGAFVSFTTAPTRIILQSSGTNAVRLLDADVQSVSVWSKNNIVGSSAWDDTIASAQQGFSLQTLGGTNTYTVIVLREE